MMGPVEFEPTTKGL